MSSSIDSHNPAGSSASEQDQELSDKLYFQSLPPGFRFAPTHNELIQCYFQCKIEGKPLPHNRIHEVNPYKYRPESLAEKFEPYENEWYFFTSREKIHKNGKRPNRSAIDGSWKATGGETAITENGKKIGSRMTLVFIDRKSPNEKKTDWIMQEYTAVGPPRERADENDMTLDDCVLCKLYEKRGRKKSEESKRRDSEV